MPELGTSGFGEPPGSNLRGPPGHASPSREPPPHVPRAADRHLKPRAAAAPGAAPSRAPERGARAPAFLRGLTQVEENPPSLVSMARPGQDRQEPHWPPPR